MRNQSQKNYHNHIKQTAETPHPKRLVQKLKPLTYKVKKNFFEEKIFLKCKEQIFGEFPWFYRNELISPPFPPRDKNNFYFSHCFIKDNLIKSDFYKGLVEPLVHQLNPSNIIEIRANLLIKDNKKIFSGFHIDNYTKSKTAILYMNTNNGYTVLGKKEKIKIKSEENKFLMFDTDTFHGGVSQTDTKRRIVLNFNYD